jgi:hypothetical protein
MPVAAMRVAVDKGTSLIHRTTSRRVSLFSQSAHGLPFSTLLSFAGWSDRHGKIRPAVDFFPSPAKVFLDIHTNPVGIEGY